VNVNATGSVALDGPGTGLFTDSEASGGGGNVTVVASRMTMENGATVSAAGSGTGDAGSIMINAGNEFLSTNSSVTTTSTLASGGNITLLANNMIRQQNSQISTSVFGGPQTVGGNILIDPNFVILQNSQIIAQANAGSGGTINIIAGVFLADPTSIVDASARSGNSGTVSIQSPVQNISGELTPMPQKFSSAAALLAQQCAARVAGGKFSTFVVAGREGLPVELGGFLGSPMLTAELLGLSSSARNPHTQFSAVTGLFQEYEARPVQLAKSGNACH
jgi:large exoprotein involved in heme utilization and adhesion